MVMMMMMMMVMMMMMSTDDDNDLSVSLTCLSVCMCVCVLAEVLGMSMFPDAAIRAVERNRLSITASAPVIATSPSSLLALLPGRRTGKLSQLRCPTSLPNLMPMTCATLSKFAHNQSATAWLSSQPLKLAMRKVPISAGLRSKY